MYFALIMLAALVITGLISLYDRLYARARRAPDAKEPVLIEYAKSFFPVILVVFVIRSFIVEPFKIPSGSMMPTLQAGDFILVNKFTYGLRVPVHNSQFLPVGRPQRGDVVVFHYPENPAIDYIKRVVGVPGDLVRYADKRLTINGRPVEQAKLGEYSYSRSGFNYVAADMWRERLGGKEHRILTVPDEPPLRLESVAEFPMKNLCTYDGNDGFTCKVPEGHYFTLGDNRDDSRDSRYWGFVPDRYLVGRAFFIWWNFGEMNRIGTVIQ